MATLSTRSVLTRAPARTIPALSAVFLGLALFLTAGFAAPSGLHNSTHDTRHALGLPCH